MLKNRVKNNTRLVVKFPNGKIVSVAVNLKCGYTSVRGILLFPRLKSLDLHNPADPDHLRNHLAPFNEYWDSNFDCPYKVDYNIAIVRNPVDRLYSLFKWTIKYDEAINESWKTFLYNFSSINKKSLKKDDHYLPQYYVLGTNPLAYDYIYNTKNLKEFTKTISDISGVKIPNVHLNQSKNTQKKPAWIGSKEKQIIMDYYKKDYQYWGEYF